VRSSGIVIPIVILCCDVMVVACCPLPAKSSVAADYAGMPVPWLGLSVFCCPVVCMAVAELHSGNSF